MIRHSRSFVMVAALCATMPIAGAAHPGHYNRVVAADTRIPANVALDDLRKPAEILDFAGFEPGDTIIDLLAGGGYYTEMLADVVGPKGQVIAANIPRFHNPEQWATIRAAHANALPMVLDFRGLAFAPNSIDGTMMHMVYHDLYWESEKPPFPHLDPQAILANLYTATRPGGTVVVVDHVGATGDTRVIVAKVHRIDPATVKADFERAGFVLDGESDLFANPDDDTDVSVFDTSIRGKTNRFVYRFRKPE